MPTPFLRPQTPNIFRVFYYCIHPEDKVALIVTTNSIAGVLHSPSRRQRRIDRITEIHSSCRQRRIDRTTEIHSSCRQSLTDRITEIHSSCRKKILFRERTVYFATVFPLRTKLP